MLLPDTFQFGGGNGNRNAMGPSAFPPDRCVTLAELVAIGIRCHRQGRLLLSLFDCPYHLLPCRAAPRSALARLAVPSDAIPAGPSLATPCPAAPRHAQPCQATPC